MSTKGAEDPAVDEEASLRQRFSSSVNRAAEGVMDRVATSVEMADRIRSVHPEYGGGWPTWPEGFSGAGERRYIREWMEAVDRLFEGDRPGDLIEGRMFVLGLAALDPNLMREMRASGFDIGLTRELKARFPDWDRYFEGVMPSAPTQEPSPPSSGAVPTHLDVPATVDLLSRGGIARSVVRRLRSLYASGKRGKPADLSEQGSFMVLVDGPWGSGKSSLLNFIRQGLENPGPGEEPWIVVDYNAWRHQRTGPPWWWLLSAVGAEARRALRRRSLVRAFRFVLGEFWWRIKSAGWVSAIFAIGLLYLAVSFLWSQGVLFPGGSLVHADPKAAPGTKAVADTIALLTTIFSLLLALARTVLPASVRGAEGFMQWSKNPSKVLTERFEAMTEGVGMRIAVLIDDLDRCQPAYVVELLEGIQTMFRNAPIVYVVAADRRWLRSCFEGTYSSFATPFTEAGRPLGHLFMEKLFQLMVSVPPMSAETRKAYWQALVLGRSPGGTSAATLRADAAEKLREAPNEEAVLEIVRTEATADPLQAQALREEAVRHLSTPAAEAQTEHRLLRFAQLLEANPRAMKRLVNAYSIHRDMMILGGTPIAPEVLARWTILNLRWPMLGEYLADKAADSVNGPLVLDDAPESLRALFKSGEVQAVFSDPECGAPLDADGLRACAGGPSAPQ